MAASFVSVQVQKQWDTFARKEMEFIEYTSVRSEHVQSLEKGNSCDFEAEMVYILPLNSAVLGLGLETWV